MCNRPVPFRPVPTPILFFWGILSGIALVICAVCAAGCIAPQYHVHIGEKHTHETAGSSAVDNEGTDTDALLHAFSSKP